MKIKRGNISLAEVAESPFISRLYFMMIGQVNLRQLHCNKNPLKWCILDALKASYFICVVVPLFIVASPFGVRDAMKIKQEWAGKHDEYYPFATHLDMR